jgi:hypothetical protein
MGRERERERENRASQDQVGNCMASSVAFCWLRKILRPAQIQLEVWGNPSHLLMGDPENHIAVFFFQPTIH